MLKTLYSTSRNLIHTTNKLSFLTSSKYNNNNVLLSQSTISFQAILKSHYSIKSTKSTSTNLVEENNRKKLVKTIYRSLLRSSTPFSKGVNYKIYLSLLHRSGTFTPTTTESIETEDKEEDLIVDDDDSKLQQSLKEESDSSNSNTIPIEYARDLSKSYNEIKKIHTQKQQQPQTQVEEEEEYQVYMRSLLQEVLGSSSSKLIRFPSQIESNEITLKELMQREFRACSFQGVSIQDRLKVSFVVLKILNQKLLLARDILLLEQNASADDDDDGKKACWHIGSYDKSSIQSGNTFLVAHPLLCGYFARTVILLLDDDTPNDDDITTPAITTTTTTATTTPIIPYKGTYGLIINRKTSIPLQNALTNLPPNIEKAFGHQKVYDGGPVNISLQMITSSSTTKHIEEGEEDVLRDIGVDPIVDNYHRGGDISKAASYIQSPSKHPKHQFHFCIGASCWQKNQIQQELTKGFWLLVHADNPGVEADLLSSVFLEDHEEFDGDEVWKNVMGQLDCKEDGALANAIYLSETNRKGGVASSSSSNKVTLSDCFVPCDEF